MLVKIIQFSMRFYCHYLSLSFFSSVSVKIILDVIGICQAGRQIVYSRWMWYWLNIQYFHEIKYAVWALSLCRFVTHSPSLLVFAHPFFSIRSTPSHIRAIYNSLYCCYTDSIIQVENLWKLHVRTNRHTYANGGNNRYIRYTPLPLYLLLRSAFPSLLTTQSSVGRHKYRPYIYFVIVFFCTFFHRTLFHISTKNASGDVETDFRLHIPVYSSRSDSEPSQIFTGNSFWFLMNCFELLFSICSRRTNQFEWTIFGCRLTMYQFCATTASVPKITWKHSWGWWINEAFIAWIVNCITQPQRVLFWLVFYFF